MIKNLNERIVVFSLDAWLDRLNGSSELTIFEALSGLGYQVTVLLPSTSNKFIKNGSFSVIGLKVKRIGSISTLFSVSLWKYFMKFLSENRPHVIIFDYWMLPLFLWAKLGLQSEGIFLIRSRPVVSTGFKGWLLFLYFRLSLIIANIFVNRFTAISPYEAMEFSRMAKISEDKMIVLPSPLGEHFKNDPSIDKDHLRLKLGYDILQNKIILLYHGVLHEQRGILEFLEVFSNSFKGDNEIALLLVGDGPAKCSIKNFIRDKNIKNIIFHGSVPYIQMPEIIQACDIGLVLLPDHLWWRYQCPIKLLEFLAMDKPVIASDLSGIKWVADNSPSIVYLKTLNVPAFKKAVQKALTIKNIKGSQKIVDRFSSSSIALKLSRIISNVCTRND